MRYLKNINVYFSRIGTTRGEREISGLRYSQRRVPRVLKGFNIRSLTVNIVDGEHFWKGVEFRILNPFELLLTSVHSIPPFPFFKLQLNAYLFRNVSLYINPHSSHSPLNSDGTFTAAPLDHELAVLCCSQFSGPYKVEGRSHTFCLLCIFQSTWSCVRTTVYDLYVLPAGDVYTSVLVYSL